MSQLNDSLITKWLNIWSTKSPHKYHILRQQFLTIFKPHFCGTISVFYMVIMGLMVQIKVNLN
jgi:hypothetical protein